MGVTLERVQFKFASIIGELCSEPRVLSQFAVWLDLRLAEYKLRGSISLECSNEKPDPTWMSGIKEEKPEKLLPYMVAATKSRRKPNIRDPPFINSAGSRHPQLPPKTIAFPDVSAENLAFQRLEHRLHPGEISDRVSSPSVVSGHKAGFSNLTCPTRLNAENRPSHMTPPIKQEIQDTDACNKPVFPVAVVANERQAVASTSKPAPSSSSSRRKRQPSAIVRNTCASGLMSSGSNFASPASSEDDPLPDSLFSHTPSKSSKLSEGTAAQSTSESVADNESCVQTASKHEEFPVDSTTNSPLTSQSEAVAPPSGGGDSQTTYNKGDDSSFMSPGVNLGWYREHYKQEYSRVSRGFFETPDQKKLRLRELAKMRQRRCRERQRIRRLLTSDPINNDGLLSLRMKHESSTMTANPEFQTNASSCSDIYSPKDNGLAANFSISE